MIRKIIQIDEDKCDGCALCVNACHEGAIGLVDGKAKLLRDDYCDGLGNCLPACPTGAITFTEREAAAYDEVAVKANMAAAAAAQTPQNHAHAHAMGGCPGSRAMAIDRAAAPSPAPVAADPSPAMSELRQWPVQLQLVPVGAPYFDGAHLLIAADCAAFAHGNFHRDFMKNRITVIGCPKLDDADYSEKLTAILKMHDVKSVTVVRMEVPCCGGIAGAAITALQNCGKMIPWRIVTLATDGEVLEG